MESLRGYEALATLPFREVAIPEAEAMPKLSGKFQEVVVQSVDIFIPMIRPETPDYEAAVEHYRQFGEKAKEVTNVGLGMGDVDVEKMYGQWGSDTYLENMMRVVSHVGTESRKSIPKGADNPASGRIGFFLDMLRLISPDVATFDNGVKVFTSAMRRTGYILEPFALGAMIDDVIRRKGSPEFPFDFYSDSQGAAIFAASYIQHANSAERQAFQQGLDITLDELHMLATGHSTN